MKLSAHKEFYGDQLVHKFRTRLKGILTLFWGILALLLATIIFGLIIGGESVVESRDSIILLLTNESGQLFDTLRIIFSIWLFLTLLPLLPAFLLLLRKHIFLRRDSFTLSASAVVESKEIVNRSRKHRIYEIKVRNPNGQRLITIRIEKKNYEMLTVGDQVQVQFNPKERQALYVLLPENGN